MNILAKYTNEIDVFGLDATWRRIISGNDSYSVSLFEHAGEMYEYGLAHANKSAKKELGKYYTPQDAAHFMSELLITRIEKSNIGCTEYHEPCVGVGDLLMELLSVMESHGMDVRDIIANHLHISDIDGTALTIAAERVRRAYGASPASVAQMDFLLDGKNMGENDAVIMNPPYGRTTRYDDTNLKTRAVRDFYPMFIEKVIGAGCSVTIVPQSFIGAESYSPLREVMSDGAGGTIYAYDNVPACVFNGRKHGIFNTNHVNSTRAAIIEAESRLAGAGYVVSPLIRWKAAERGRLFDASRAAVSESRNVQSGGASWRKLPDSIVPLFDSLSASTTIGDIASADGKFSLTVPASIRYYVTASFRVLSRSSKHVLHFDTEDAANAAYIALNSNLAYAFWRAYDGGITITSSLLSKIPVPAVDASGDFIDSEIGKRIGERAEELRAMEDSCVIVKMNAGKPNENIKFGDTVLAENTEIILPDATDAELQAMRDYRSPSLSWLLDS